MKITDVETVLLTGPCSNDPFITECRKLRSAAFIEVHTDSGMVGIGETYAGYFCPEIVPGIVEFFKPILVGQTVEDIQQLWDRMFHCGNYWCRVGLGVGVMSGIEAALWDLKGKAEGLPVYELLGGRKHEKLPCYATGGPSNYPKDRLAAKVDFYLSLGFRAFKLGVGSFSSGSSFTPSAPAEAADFEADKMTFLRSHVGNDVSVLLDGHMGNSPDITWDLPTAQAVVKALEPYDLFFFEEPLHYTDPWGYAELCRSTSVPIAGGECLTTVYEWRMFVESASFDIGQPDAAFTGGLGEFLKVAAVFASRGRKIATHSWGAGGALLQNLHCGFACANTVILEIPPAMGGLHTDVADGSFVMEEGMALPPDKPGLGIVLTDEIKNRYPFVPGSGEFNSVPGKILTD
ncbi:MAG: mandelate racemase/muconate lactonizing enzyme family protein [Armatimonadetes bacterium]|nr:mandelate racemase/muconate lactonizing enzyme family protein [Armatimonadota bacterium]